MKSVLSKVGASLAAIALGSGLLVALGTGAAATSSPKAWVVGVSGGYYGNVARVQIEAEIKAYAALPSVKPHIKKLIINNAGTNTAAQISAVDDMISEHVNLILLTTTSLTGLNGAIAAAHKAGIPVIAYNNRVSSPYAYQVQTVGKRFGETMMQGLVRLLHGKGNIVELRGIAGNAVDEAEASGFNAVVAKNRGIHVLNVSYATWNTAKAQQDMSDLLSRYSDINGVFTEGGMEQGVVRAYLAAHKPFVPVTGTDENGFACMIRKYHSKGLTGVQVGSQLWEGALALKVGLAILSGKKEPRFIPIKPISWGTDEAIKLCQPKLSPAIFLNVDDPATGITLTPEQVLRYMKTA